VNAYASCFTLQNDFEGTKRMPRKESVLPHHHNVRQM